MFFRRFASIYAFDLDSFLLTGMDIFLLGGGSESRPSACVSTAYICVVGGRVHSHTSRSLHGNGVPPAITTRQPTLQNSKIVAPLSPIIPAQKNSSRVSERRRSTSYVQLPTTPRLIRKPIPVHAHFTKCKHGWDA